MRGYMLFSVLMRVGFRCLSLSFVAFCHPGKYTVMAWRGAGGMAYPETVWILGVMLFGVRGIVAVAVDGDGDEREV